MPKQIQKEVQISIKLIPIIGYTYNPKKFFSYASYKKFPEMELYGSIIPKMDIFRKKNIIYIVVTEK